MKNSHQVHDALGMEEGQAAGDVQRDALAAARRAFAAGGPASRIRSCTDVAHGLPRRTRHTKS